MWKVLIDQDALKYLESLEKRKADNIKRNLRLLKESPYPGQGMGDKKKVVGTSKTAYRMRIGDHRAFYIAEENSRTVKITEIMTAEVAHKKYGQM